MTEQVMKKPKQELLAPGEVTVTLPQGMDCRDPRNREAPWDRSSRLGGATEQANLDALLFGRGALQTTHIPHDQLMQQSLQAPLQASQCHQFLGAIGLGIFSNLTGRRQ